MPTELYHQDGHSCLMFHDLCDVGGEAVQANQFLIVDDHTGAIIDPGGNLAYNDLFIGVTRHFPPNKLSAILASHADPDIVASLDRWTTSTQAKIYVSTLWERFLPHFCKPGKTEGRIIGIPDAGMRIRIGRHDIVALPAHFLHAEGNFQFYDPVSRILFSGDLGVSMLEGKKCATPVRALADVLPHMEAFHRRYMVSNKILRCWADMVETLKIDMIVPQHGAPLAGPAVQEFIDWARELQCGVDLFGPRNYVVPR
ncbi:MBL fold metallo-hydrolase [Ideonella sp. A 288]|uniref:MBL fold metallo-hydrolase n=1 Tax=Ideonella sp. A 288 TaxID=1962181 RepID=UPI000B4BD8DC|nr:MBL fold metallo-hydrolase [Ideonella sp. A 288]